MDVIEYLLDGDSDDSDDDSLLIHFATTHLRTRVRKSWKEFSDVEFREFFRFDKSDFPRLRSALLVPETLRTRSRTAFNGDDAVVLTLCRLGYPCRQKDLAAQFELSVPQVSQ